MQVFLCTALQILVQWDEFGSNGTDVPEDSRPEAATLPLLPDDEIFSKISFISGLESGTGLQAAQGFYNDVV